jgi:hypothetical protein
LKTGLFIDELVRKVLCFVAADEGHRAKADTDDDKEAEKWDFAA